MRIALIGPAHPYKGGGARHTTELAHRLAAAGHDVIIESWRAQYPRRLYPGQQTVDEPEGEPYPRTHRRLAWYRPDGWLAAGRRLRSADLVVFALLTPLQVPPYLAVMAGLGRQPGRPRTAVICHNVLPHERRPGDVALTKTLLKHADTVITHSAGQAAQARELAPGATVLTVRIPPHLPATGPPKSWGRTVLAPRPRPMPPAVLRHRPSLQGPGRAAAGPGRRAGARHADRRGGVLGRHRTDREADRRPGLARPGDAAARLPARRPRSRRCSPRRTRWSCRTGRRPPRRTPCWRSRTACR